MIIHAIVGTVSHGTLRTEDLLESFAATLESLIQANAPHWCGNQTKRDNLLQLVWDAREAETNPEPEALVDELIEALNYFAPEGHYFGAHEGDGSDFGYWSHN